MKKIFLFAILIASLDCNAQLSTLYSCAPNYPVPAFQQSADSTYGLDAWFDAGIVNHNGINVWFNWGDTAHIFNLSQSNYTSTLIPGSGLANLQVSYDQSKVFSYNGDLFFADRKGIRNGSTLQYWAYPDTLSRYIPFADTANGYVWILTGELYTGEASVLKFDGSDITAYNSGAYVAWNNSSAFMLGDTIFFSMDGSSFYPSFFNMNDSTYNYFSSFTYSNFNISLLKALGKNENGNLIAVGFDTSGNKISQELIGDTWQPASTVPLGVYYDPYEGILYPQVSGSHLVLIDPMYGYTYVLKKINNNYVLLDTLTTDYMLGYCLVSTAYDSDSALCILNPNVDTWASNCNNDNTIYLKVSTTSNFLFGTGSVFLDVNQNGIFDGTDDPISYQNVCNSFTTCGTSNTEGEYTILLSADSNIVTSNPIINFITIPISYNLTNVDSSMANLNFAYQADTVINDLAIAYIFSTPSPRPGFEITYHLSVENTGTLPLSDTLIYTFDSLFTYIGASPSPLYQSGNTIAWLTGNINPLQSANFSVDLTLSASAVIGNTVTSVANVDVVNEGNANNNSYSLTQTIVGSWDPNDKAANPPYYVQDGEDIQYTIRFQNTGSDTAFNIVVRDTLDANLDGSTFRLLYASHEVNTELNLQNGAVAFSFNNILLPDSNTNEPASHGTIVYAIETQNDLVDNTAITNSASIYFDFNAPVVTNTTLNVIGDVVSVQNISSENHLLLIPNPAKQSVTLHYKGTGKTNSYGLVDVMGRNAMIGKMITNNINLSLDAIAAGTYTVVIYDSTGNVLSRSRLAVVK